MKSKIHISQFYPCSEVKLACELYYICELGKYLHFNYDECVSIDGIILNSCLSKSPIWDYFRMAVSEGWVCDTGIPSSDLEITIQFPLVADLSKVTNVLFTTEEVEFDKEDYNNRRNNINNYAYITPEKFQVSFARQDNDIWLWEMSGKNGSGFNINNKVFGHNLAHQRWVSLVAYVAVNRLKEGFPMHLGIKLSQSVVMASFTSPTYLNLLKDDGHCFVGWCHILYDDNVSEQDKLQIEYASWYYKGKDLGMLDRWYSGKEKFEYLKKLDICKGDIVAVYERAKSTKANYIKRINSCHIARVTFVTDTDIGFELFNTCKLKYQGKLDFNDKTIAVKKMYLGKKLYEEFNSTKMSVPLAELGVEYMMHTERYFIVPLDQCDDSIVTMVTNGTSSDKLILPQNEFIYWLLKDYNIEFNEQRFKNRYIKGAEPLYDMYMRGETLSDVYYKKD